MNGKCFWQSETVRTSNFSICQNLYQMGKRILRSFFGAEGDRWRVEEAAKLYRGGIVGKVLITGGISPYNQDQENSEAVWLASYALECGIAERDLLVEREATCSEENVRNSLDLLKGNGCNPCAMSYVVVSSDFHLKRCVTLLRNALGGKAKIYYAASAYHPSANRGEWRNTNEGRFLILKETWRIVQATWAGRHQA